MKQLRPCATLIQAPDTVNARWMIGKRESPGPAEHCMKTLFLIRHAKSSWDDIALPDKDRSLNDRGRRDAPKMGKRLAKRNVTPDLILSSPARRALTTAEIIAKKLDYKLKDIVVDDRLYAGAADDLLKVIQKLGDKLESVMLFGHNPELTELAHRLSSEITHMPTCAVAEFAFNAKSWSNIGKAKVAKVALDYPKKS
jgi:phosphohistidine phosphatase